MRLTAAILNVASGLTLFAGPAIAENWPMYGGNLRHTFSNHDLSITAMNVGKLKKSWSFTVGDAIRRHSPTICKRGRVCRFLGRIFLRNQCPLGFADLEVPGRLSEYHYSHSAAVPCSCPTPPPRFFTNGGLITSTAAV